MITQNFTYNADKRHLILLTSKGRPIISIAGAIAKKMYERMHEIRGGLTDMTAIQLEAKIKNLNDWLTAHEPLKDEDFYRDDYKLKTHARDYYVNKLIELQESSLKTIKA